MGMSPMTPEVTLTDTPDPSIRGWILDSLVRFNEERAGPHEFRPLAVLINDPEQDRLLGGLWGSTYWGWLYVELFFVSEALRGQGFGTRLLGAAEDEAIARGCRAALLDTFSFQARGFYERLGYSVFATLEDYPPGHRRHYLCKRLDAGSNLSLQR
jgi:GNAT superfamily N-acetyltransferase